MSFCSQPSADGDPDPPPCPRTARHAPPVTKFLPDLKLLRDVKISVSFAEACNSKDRKVLYTGVGQEGGGGEAGAERVNGGLHDATELGPVEGSSGGGNSAGCPFRGGGGGEEVVEADLENNVEFAVLDELEDFSENFLDPDYGAQGGFRSEVKIGRAHV